MGAHHSRLASVEEYLLRQFQDIRLEQAIPGQTISNQYGSCYLIDECISELENVYYNSLAGFCKNDTVAIVDLETLGLRNKPIVLLGLVNIKNGMAYLHQFLVRDTSEELAALWAFLSYVEDGCSLVTYNGRRFDISARALAPGVVQVLACS